MGGHPSFALAVTEIDDGLWQTGLVDFGGEFQAILRSWQAIAVDSDSGDVVIPVPIVWADR